MRRRQGWKIIEGQLPLAEENYKRLSPGQVIAPQIGLETDIQCLHVFRPPKLAESNTSY